MSQLVRNVTTNSSTVHLVEEKGDQTHLVVMMVIGGVMIALGLIMFCRYLASKCGQFSRRVSVPFYSRFSGLVAKADTENILASDELEAETYHSQFRVESFNLAASSDSSGTTSPSLTPSPREENTASTVLERLRGGGWQRF